MRMGRAILLGGATIGYPLEWPPVKACSGQAGGKTGLGC